MALAQEWHAKFSPIGSPDHVHAVGAFALYYNALEMALFGLIMHFMPEPPKLAVYIYQALHNRSRVDLIRLLGETVEAETAKKIEHAVRCFDLCAENRNLILHAIPGWGEEKGSDALTLLKSAKSDPYTFAVYDFTLEQVRQAAISAAETELYIIGLLSAFDYEAQGIQPQWPPKPPLPRKLSLSRRPRDH